MPHTPATAPRAMTQYTGAEKLPSTYVEGFHNVEAVKKMIYRPLGGDTDIDVSALSFGASSVGGCFRDTQLAESIEVVHLALKSGINWVDTAAWYGFGKSEEVLGKALKGVPRSAYYLSTKCCRYRPEILDMFDWTEERTLRSVDESLARLGIEYIDVMQIHDPEYCPDVQLIVRNVLPALAKAKAAGKIRKIGITGYPLHIHKEIMKANKAAGGPKVDTCLSYCHYSMNDSSLVKDWLPWLREEKLGLIGAAAISMGLLSSRGPPDWHPATQEIKDACAAASKYCEQQGVDISNLAMWYSLHSPSAIAIPTTLVSTASLARMQKNLDSVYATALAEKDKAVFDHVMTTWMLPLKDATWEGIEVGQYREMHAKALRGEEVGTLSTKK